jgi:hypothetical protein
MSDVGIGTGKVVVNRAMSLNGFIAGPGHAMDWILDLMTEGADPEVMAATGAMLIGRRTYEVGKQMADEDTAYDGGAQFVRTQRRGRQEPGDPRCRRGRPVPAARARRRDPGVCPTGATR